MHQVSQNTKAILACGKSQYNDFKLHSKINKSIIKRKIELL